MTSTSCKSVHAHGLLASCTRLSVVAVVLACWLQPAWSQPAWQTCGSNLCASTGANIGIGTTGASYPLTVVGAASISSYLQTPHINGANSLLFDTGNNSGDISFGAAYMTVKSGGNVGIGTTSPQSKLSVNGTVQAKEVLVNTGWSDYVFAPEYRLRPLNEVASYIREHHHLPEIPSAREVEEKGVSLGEMQAKLLAKIEELTLHMIHADERNDRLEQQNREMREKLAELGTRYEKR